MGQFSDKGHLGETGATDRPHDFHNPPIGYAFVTTHKYACIWIGASNGAQLRYKIIKFHGLVLKVDLPICIDADNQRFFILTDGAGLCFGQQKVSR